MSYSDLAKKGLVISFALLFLLASIHFARLPIINTLASNYLKQYSSKITCLDFQMSSALSFELTQFIPKVCVQTPQANIELKNVALSWQLSFKRLSPQIAITGLKIDNANITGTAPLFTLNKNHRQKSNKPYSLNDIKQWLTQFSQLKYPKTLEIKSIEYQPYFQDSTVKKFHYWAQLSRNKNSLIFSIETPKKTQFVNVKLTPTNESLAAAWQVKLSPLRLFLLTHQIAIPTKLDEDVIVKGELSSQLQWRTQSDQQNQATQQNEQSLIVKSELTNFSLDCLDQESLFLPFKVNNNGSLNWQTTLSDDALEVTFSPSSQFEFAYSKVHLLNLLTANNVSSQLIELIKTNASQNISIQPQGSLEVDFDQNELFLTRLTLNNKSRDLSTQLTLDKLFLALQDEKLALKQTGFSLESQLNINTLNKISTSPIAIKADGQINHNLESWRISLQPTTQVSLSAVQITPSKTKTQEGKVKEPKELNSLVTAGELISQWQGELSIAKNHEVTFDLQMHSKIKHINVQNAAQIDQAKINATINGTFHDIKVLGSANADRIDFAKFSFSGNMLSPKMKVYADNIPLTEVLALKLELPFLVKPIDGNMSYQLSGQLSKLADGENSPIKLAIDLQNLTGELNDIWAQEINWRHNFILSNNNIQSDKSTNLNNNNKLTISQLGTEPQLTNLSTQTEFNLKASAIKLNVTNATAELLDGNINIAKAHWPMSPEHSVDVQLNKIDLEKLLALDKKQGIVVTGKISGVLPVTFANEKFTIANGELHNVGNGLIQLNDNPAVEQLKAGSTELKLAFDALENLHYHQLTSEVSMADDGYMLLDTKIKGRNPDIDNDVNLNLNLSYDLLGLLESLNITQQLENKLIKELQEKERP